MIIVDQIWRQDREKLEFEKDEDRITDLLLASSLLALPTAIKEFDDYMMGKIDNIQRLVVGLNIISPTLSNIQTDDIDIAYRARVEDAIKRGARVTNREEFLKVSSTKEPVKNGIVRSSKYHVNKMFNGILALAIIKKAEKRLEQGVAGREIFKEAVNTIETRYKSPIYWEIVANASASRAYHYGLVKGAQGAGFSRVIFKAILDKRTSEICKKLNGKSWLISDVVQQYEQVAISNDPESIKALTPWIAADDYDALSDIQMVQAGVIAPPRHAHCRSTLVIDRL